MRVQNLEEARRMLARLKEELPEAHREATKQLVYAVWNGEQAQAVADFDRPVQFTMKSILYQVNPNDQGPGGRVYIKDRFRGDQVADEAHYLGVNALGGTRDRKKGSEIALQNMGIMQQGHVWVPDKRAALDASGNVSSRAIRVMIEEFRRFGRERNASRQFYARGQIGVYMRVGDEFYPFLWFMSPRRYEKLFDFYGRADRDIAYSFDEIYDKAIRKALDRAAT